VQKCTNVQQYRWQDFFNAPSLQQLIVLALKNNRDLKAALQRIEEARALYGLPTADQLSTVNCASWETVFWCRLKSLEGAELESYLATIEAKRSTFICLIRQIANTYLIDAELSELVNATLNTIKVRKEGARIMKLRFEVGAASKFEFLEAESFLQQAEAELATLQRKREVNWNAMTLLVGTPVCSDNHLLSQIEPYFTKEIFPGVPAELLCNRPDVREAEHKLRAANESMGPRRRCSSCLALPKAERDLAATDYERTIQVAFREVSDALAELTWLTEQTLIQKEMLIAQTELARLAWLDFRCSTLSFLEVLEAEQKKFSAEQAFIETLRSLLASKINLYTALGGGYCR